MLVSLNWIKQLTEIKLSKEELIEKIASQIGEIEEVTELGEVYKGIIVAEIAEAEEHPEADKLGVYKVNLGRVKVQVVAGDKSLKPGDKVAYIAPGIAVPSSRAGDQPFFIKKVNLRGKESNGMMASGKELGFNDNHENVLRLDSNLKPGTQLTKAYELDDTILEIENKALTHRPDCFGLLGIAREVAGVQGIKFKTPEWFTKTAANVKLKDEQLPITVKNEVPNVCRRISLIAMSAVSVKPSDILMQTYLSRVGIRPISNVVDVTNYVMALTGQPLHAFDYEKVVRSDKKKGTAHIVVRFPKRGEKLKLLDGREIKPHDKAILIANSTTPLSVAGAMGGADSEVDENTQKIIIECANFDLYSIRSTSMKHGLFTEAVTRFARGQDPEQTLPVLMKAVQMIQETAGGMIASEVTDNYPKPAKPINISVNAEKISAILGETYTDQQITETLNNVEIETKKAGKNITVTPPSWRQDLHIQEDVAEEVGRLNGYGKISARLPYRSISPVEEDRLNLTKRLVRQSLVNAGSNEVLTYNFVSDAMFDLTGQDRSKAYRIRNSISPELQYMRTSLLPSVADKVYQNVRAGYEKFALFEINKSHSKLEIGEQKLPYERQSCAFIFAADKKPAAKLSGAPYYEAKKYLDHVAKQLGVELEYQKINAQTAWINNLKGMFHPKRAALVTGGGKVVGVIGEFTAQILHNFKLPIYTAAFEVDLEILNDLRSNKSKYAKLSQFPKTDLDVTLKTPNSVSYHELHSLLSMFVNKRDIKTEVKPLTIYKSDHEKSTRSISFRVTLQHMAKTLDTKEANKILDSAVQGVAKRTGAKQVE